MRPAPCCGGRGVGEGVRRPHEQRLDLVRRDAPALRRSAAPQHPRRPRSTARCRCPGTGARRYEHSGAVCVQVGVGLRRLTTRSPGATRSGLRVPSPSLENEETTSSAVVGRAIGVLLPTAMTYGSVGRVVDLARCRSPRCRRRRRPRCPCARPARPHRPAGRAGRLWTPSVPNDMFSTRTFRPVVVTVSRRPSRWPRWPARRRCGPSASATLRLTMRASGAMPT